ncbi:murein transglycosylase A [Roseibium polysiphoniae]|nr:MltA domain-containing protein [Roseibium polysiphoniae]
MRQGSGRCVRAGLLGFCLGVGALLMVTEETEAAPAGKTPDGFVETGFDALPGWADDNHADALSAFLRFCRSSGTLLSKGPIRLSAERADEICKNALAAEGAGNAAARAFFEAEFVPHVIDAKGFVTGYYEPELAASRTQSGAFPAPLLKAPEGLVQITSSNRPRNWPEELSHGRQTAKGIVPLPDRPAIMAGALAEEGLDLVYLSDPVEAFFVHVQGSARLRLTDGAAMRVGYAGKTGHPYTSVARVLVNRGEGTPEQLTMTGLRKWFVDNPDRRDELLGQNRSYIFFREVEIEDPKDGPIGAAGLPLVAGRSLAVDLAHLSLGLPIFLETSLSDVKDLSDVEGLTADLRRLVIADDTGSSIKGAARGDLFVGSGLAAGRIAGDIRHAARMTVLLPKSARSERGNR